jgi:hypothetical protein
LLSSIPNIITVIKYRIMSRTGQSKQMGEMRNSYKILVRKFQGKRTVGSPTWENNEVMKKWGLGKWTGIVCLWRQSCDDICEHDNGDFGAIKVLERLD